MDKTFDQVCEELKAAAQAVASHPDSNGDISLLIDEFIDELSPWIDEIKQKVASAPDPA